MTEFAHKGPLRHLHKEEVPEMTDPCGLTDDELKATLLEYGVEAGPIVATTRSIYERKLQSLLQPAQPRQNGGTGDADQYSDSEEEEEEDEWGSEQGRPETVSLVEEYQHSKEQRAPGCYEFNPNRNAGNHGNVAESSTTAEGGQFPPPPVTPGHGAGLSRSSSLLGHPTGSVEPVTDVLMEMFPETEPTRTGIAATRRRPIKGAAGRPVQFKYPNLPASPMTLQRQAVEHRLVPLWVQILVFLILTCLLYLIYAALEHSSEHPFVALLDNLSMGTETEGLSVQAEP